MFQNKSRKTDPNSMWGYMIDLGDVFFKGNL